MTKEEALGYASLMIFLEHECELGRRFTTKICVCTSLVNEREKKSPKPFARRLNVQQRKKRKSGIVLRVS